MDDGPAWFAPKRRGFGSGLPIAWQGWALLIAYILAVLALGPVAERSLPAYLSAFTGLTALFMLICAKTTPGGWRNRK
ncbi:hypothetical protein [Sphingomonas humi]|uniref:Uncharacterized protein n=1 Tax=Sphingomonas humi TaxID=335630 RepID=A0ABP7RLS9_9SPHN